MSSERTTKKYIRQALDFYEGRVYYDMYVPSGYGKPSLDFVCCAKGLYFAIEAKAWNTNKKPTLRQDGTIIDMQAAGAIVFIVNDQPSLDVLIKWLGSVME